MIAVVAGSFAAVAVALLGRPAPDLRSADEPPPGDSGRAEDRPLLRRLSPLLSGLAAVAGWTVLGGIMGFAVGMGAAALSWRALARLESPTATRRRRELERDLPVAVHLLAACLAAGAATTAALDAVSDAMPSAAGEELALVRRRLEWGSDPVAVWSSLEGPLAPLGSRMARAHESGASVQHAVTRLAEDLRNESRSRADRLARTVEVRAAAPLGLCFLPSFVLLGIIPLAAGLFASLSLFR